MTQCLLKKMPHEDDKLIPDRARKDGIPAEVAEGIKNQVDSTGHALGKKLFQYPILR